MAEAHAEAGDFVLKEGEWVRIEEVDAAEDTYYTSDGGCMGFDEIGPDDVFLESEVPAEALARLL